MRFVPGLTVSEEARVMRRGGRPAAPPRDPDAPLQTPEMRARAREFENRLALKLGVKSKALAKMRGRRLGQPAVPRTRPGG